jgi:hypothetical protein
MSSTDGRELMEDRLLQLHTMNLVNDLTKPSLKSSVIFKIIHDMVTNILISDWNLSSLLKPALQYTHDSLLFPAKNTLGTLHTQHTPSQLS